MKRAAIVSPPAARKLLYAGLGPAPTLFGFRGRDEARAAKAGEIGRRRSPLDAVNVSIGALLW